MLRCPKLGEHISDNMKERMTEMKTNHREPGAMADKMETMNVTQPTDQLAGTPRVWTDNDGRCQELAR